MKQLTLFSEAERMTSREAIDITIASLQAYAPQYEHWTASYSGGKDSSCLVTLIADLIETKRIPRPKSLTVLYADTRMELPPLHISAMGILKEMENRGFNTQVVTAPLDKRFLVYILGRGVPPPNNNTLRWCTQQIKLNPMIEAMQKIHAKYGKVLSMNGVRIGESAVRDRRILTSCSKNGSECGQGWFQRDLPDAICDKLAPILHWRVCQVWDWLMLDAPRIGFPTEILAEAYGGDEAQEINARTGCIGCPLASKDLALEAVIKQPQWAYLSPLLGMRSLFEWARSFENRLQKDGERLKNGSYSAAPNRKGPLTLEARLKMLEQVLKIQSKVNERAVQENKPQIDLINPEEHARILELIEAKTFPNKWDGTEPLGNELIPQVYKGGAIQPLLW